MMNSVSINHRSNVKKDLSKDLVSKCQQSLPSPIKPVRYNKRNVAFSYSLRNFSAAFDTVDHNLPEKTTDKVGHSCTIFLSMLQR